MNYETHGFVYWVWGLAERADWYGWWPKRFWRWLLQKTDKHFGVLKMKEEKHGED